jgi:hypothetical protein
MTETMKNLIIAVSIFLTSNVAFSQKTEDKDKKEGTKEEKKEEKKKNEKKITPDENKANNNINALGVMNQFTDNPYSGIRTLDTRYEGIVGTPYLEDKWTKGELIMTDGSVKSTSLKYDIAHKEVIIKRPLGDSLIVDSWQIKGFRIIDDATNTILPFVKVEKFKTMLGEQATTFLLVLYNKKVGLFKHLDKRIIKANYKGAYNTTDRRFDSYEDQSEYFFRKTDNSIVKIKFSKKSVLEAMKDKEDLIKTYLEKEKIDFKNEDVLFKVIKYYESL